MLYTCDLHNIVHQLYFSNKNFKFKKKENGLMK